MFNVHKQWFGLGIRSKMGRVAVVGRAKVQKVEKHKNPKAQPTHFFGVFALPSYTSHSNSFFPTERKDACLNR
jgi:hypothetical protein